MHDLTVFIPTFNRSDFLENTLRINLSMINTIRPIINLVVLDNASTDSTFDVCKKYGVNYIRNDCNIGLQGSFKKILKYSYSKNIPVLIISDEDVIDPRFLSRMSEIQCQPNSVIIGGYNNVHGRDDKARRNKFTLKGWSDLDIMYHGLISGYIFNISEKKLLDRVLKLIEPRNLFPHYAMMMKGINWTCSGVPTCFTLFQDTKTHLYDEWESKSHHLSHQSIYLYESFIFENYITDKDLKNYLKNLHMVSTIYNLKYNTNSKMGLLILLKYLFTTKPHLIIKYALRYLGS